MSNNYKTGLKILDFGLARFYKSFSTGELISLNSTSGSSFYMAPEIISKNYSYQCDIWSAGVILYILLSGYPPFSGSNTAETLTKVKEGAFHFNFNEWTYVSQEGKELIIKMLKKNPSERINAQEVLDDPWLKENKVVNNFNIEITQNLKKFLVRNTFQKIVFAYLATQCSEKDIINIKNLFLELDKNHDGHLSYEEFSEIFKGRASNEEIKNIMNSIDFDRNGLIDYSEFLAASIGNNIYPLKERLLEAFKLFDRNHSGKISANDLKLVLGNEVDEGSLEQVNWDKIIEEVDSNKDGLIDYEEFLNATLQNY